MYGIPQRGGKIWNRDDWFPIEGESKWPYALRMMTEGHTVLDAFLTCACAQVSSGDAGRMGGMHGLGAGAGRGNGMHMCVRSGMRGGGEWMDRMEGHTDA